MTALFQAVEDYLELRRGLGFKLREYGGCLREFVAFLAERNAERITSVLPSNTPAAAGARNPCRGHGGSASSAASRSIDWPPIL
jgi:hypothetical protein